MLHLNNSKWNWGQNLAKTCLLTLLAVTLSLGLSGAGWNFSSQSSGLPAGNAITDGKVLLRNALPIDNPTVRELQASLEDIAYQLRANRRWNAIASDVSKASMILSERTDKLLASIPAEKQGQAQSAIAAANEQIVQLRAAIENKDKTQVKLFRNQTLDIVGQLEELMVQQFPFEIPSEYSQLPQLKGRATVEMVTDKGKITIVVDGYSAPVTAGNFVDLVQRGFYDGLEFIRAEDSFYVQAGDPLGEDDGFIDPNTSKYRTVPLEVLVKGDPTPTYGITLEDAGRYRDQPVLPFSAYGTVAMARPESEPDGGSSQFFFFLFEAELTPAGRNLMDGRYSVFGYVTEGQDILRELKAGDKIQSAKVIQGAENLVQPTAT